MRLLREIDIPPLWLALFGAAGWGLSRLFAIELPGGRAIGWALVGLGVSVVLAAVAQMSLRRTSAIPRRTPAALVSDGLFALSRNPIYLGDAVALAGWLLACDAVWTLWLVPVFMALIQHRYIRPEESALHAAFGAAFPAYCARTRRWI